ncbi:MAG TPA: alpha/beta hydrolase [Puia sp.]|jgi:2-hydroxy-6-oxonona-2,4-dienedioate hydrolase|nr:alpha/beta hydrolase [Puia sp.]
MSSQAVVKLDVGDPRVIEARESEKRLFDFYGLKTKTNYITLPVFNIRIRITEIGSGKPVIIVPGNTGDSFPFASLLAELKGRRLIVLNRPGGGLSEGIDHRTLDFRKFAVQTITAVMDAFLLDKAPLIGHSIGGQWCLWMAMDKPDRITAVTTLGVPGNIISTKPPFALRLLSVPGLNSLMFKLIRPKDPSVALRGLSFMGHSKETINGLPAALNECYFYFQQLPNFEISGISLMQRGNLLNARSEDRISATQLTTIKQPVMFLWGSHDPFGTVETGKQIADFIPTSEFREIQNGGHLPWLDEPAECGRLISRFFSNV